MPVDELSQDFLRVLLEQGGDADTTVIRSETGMSRGQVNHRFRKLEELDWIRVERAQSGKGERTPPKVAVLTDQGEESIRSGEAGSKILEDDKEEEDQEEVEISRDQLEEFHEELDGMKNRLNVVVEKMNDGQGQKAVQKESPASAVEEERVEKLEREVARLRETVELLNEAVSKDKEDDKIDNKEDEKNQQTDSGKTQIDDDVIRELRDQQEYLEEWMDVAQRHMMAMRIYMEENDEGMDEYLDKAAERQNR